MVKLISLLRAELVSIDELIVLPMLLPNTPATLTVQLLPGSRLRMVWALAVPSTMLYDSVYGSVSHNS